MSHLPERTSQVLKEAARLVADEALRLQQSDFTGPKGVTDRLMEFGNKVEFGNCIVTITCELRNDNSPKASDPSRPADAQAQPSNGGRDGRNDSRRGRKAPAKRRVHRGADSQTLGYANLILKGR